jgi:hypothetical protein
MKKGLITKVALSLIIMFSFVVCNQPAKKADDKQQESKTEEMVQGVKDEFKDVTDAIGDLFTNSSFLVDNYLKTNDIKM